MVPHYRLLVEMKNLHISKKNDRYFKIFSNRNTEYTIGLYTPINYFGGYATCSHKDGRRSMFSLGKPLTRRTTWYAYNYVGARKFKPCVLSHLQDGIFYKYAVLKHILSLWRNFFVAATPSLWPKFLRSSNTMPRRHSYTRTMRRFPVSKKLPVSNHRKRTF